MHLDCRNKLAITLIAIEFVLNVAMRPFGDPTYTIGNIVCLILLSIALCIVAKSGDRIMAIALFCYTIQILPDTIWFIPCIMEPNDWLILSAIAGAVVNLYLQAKGNRKISRTGLFIISAIVVKAYSRHVDYSFVTTGERSVYEIGDALTHLLMASYLLIHLRKNIRTMQIMWQIIPVILLAGTFVNLEKNIIGDPHEFHPAEIAFMLIVVGYELYILFKRKMATAQ
jgi:hypothetical protein